MSSNLKHSLPLQANASELDALVRRFAEVERPRYGVRIDPGPDGLNALREVLQEIDETMLSRRLLIKCEPGESATLLISNRRLLAVEMDYNSQPTSPRTPKDAARNFAAALRAVISNAKDVILSKPQPLCSYEEADLSVSASLLAHALGLDDFHSSEADPAEEEASIRSMALASIDATRDLAFSNPAGPHEQVTQLKDFWQVYAASSTKDGPQKQISGQPRTCCLFPLNDTLGVVVTTEDHQTWQLAIVPRARFQDILKAWPSELSSA